ncbi:hypothetical protein JI739_16530 [Ramlibacter sp. AW1]|uniref:Uncharacterized protein n=1 Tax=Ramlibacter aurantiacus TaxID=2801330 RepID=A0A937D7F2_9BURK|nr:hypothetical protein [Ramlibacter aurantiacus]MBL0421958.1 hypothetical protein [Ramlibacter aurantiacus]
MSRCAPGDLAIVVRAEIEANLGRIVRVLHLHDGRGDLVLRHAGDAVWWVEAAAPLTWARNGQRICRTNGPVPDGYLMPIKGDGADDAESLDVDQLATAQAS